MEILFVLILIIVVLLVYVFATSHFAKVQSETEVALPPDRVIGIVEKSFAGITWRRVDGPGTVNFRRRSINDSGPVMSVDILRSGSDGSIVQVWMSHFTTRGPAVNFAESAIGQRRKIIRRVEQAAAPSPIVAPSSSATTLPTASAAPATAPTPAAIPVQSRPATAPAGWYDDGSGRQRYWDGAAWTEHFAP